MMVKRSVVLEIRRMISSWRSVTFFHLQTPLMTSLEPEPETCKKNDWEKTIDL
jgi:hypothetical protein